MSNTSAGGVCPLTGSGFKLIWTRPARAQTARACRRTLPALPQRASPCTSPSWTSEPRSPPIPRIGHRRRSCATRRTSMQPSPGWWSVSPPFRCCCCGSLPTSARGCTRRRTHLSASPSVPTRSRRPILAETPAKRLSPNPRSRRCAQRCAATAAPPAPRRAAPRAAVGGAPPHPHRAPLCASSLRGRPPLAS
ncbi:hypothetical protein BU14_0081s0015 [Porphyra umbilicalis]|uniref:Uncharacterized protein n=1 Tax=Porphyra umbilicalis TaxID=2786 RepID=A0A1X6NTG0_PORUM|nr:hypothetical protein BU14_0491s0010 [Porphyra umbilicalis]OSX79335.1 hypothetical protein BU14_0081s0015 [Porphyra umbilicalis]|eukprot:OSX71902.1 hypothetical protein BU14_0491s0010 [Porphyra umbilicalis]